MTTNADNRAKPLTLAPEPFDIRTVERFLADGSVRSEDYQAYLDSLEDCADNADISNVTMVAHRRPRRMESAREEEES